MGYQSKYYDSFRRDRAERILRWMGVWAFLWALVGISFNVHIYFTEEPQGLRVLKLNDWPVEWYAPVVTGGYVVSNEAGKP